MRRRSPAVSVVVPCLDAERWLGETIESVQTQTWDDWELILIDDGSKDASPRIAAAHARRDPERIRCLQHPGGAHRGAFASRVLGAARARADVIALLDADDLWDPDYLKKHLKFWRRLKNPKVSLSYGPARYWFPFDPSGAQDFTHPMPSLTAQVFAPGELPRNFLSSGYATMPRTSCSLVRREAVLELAHFEAAAKKFPLCEDLFLMWGLAIRWPAAVHTKAMVRYRQRCPLAERPKSYIQDTLRDELAFLAIIRDYLREFHPRHPLLRAEGIPARIAALRGRGRDDCFFKRIPQELRRLAPARP